DVHGGLDAAAPDEPRLAELDRALDVPFVDAGGLRLELRGDAIALELHEDVVEVVPVGRRALARPEVHLPDADAVVLEEQPGGDVAERAGHRIFSSSVTGRAIYEAVERLATLPAAHVVDE